MNMDYETCSLHDMQYPAGGLCPNCHTEETHTHVWVTAEVVEGPSNLGDRLTICAICHVRKRPTAKVILFRGSGKYYTQEEWLIPTEEEAKKVAGFRYLPGDMMGPYCMVYSPDFRRIDNGKVLVESQEPWGYPYLL